MARRLRDLLRRWRGTVRVAGSRLSARLRGGVAGLLAPQRWRWLAVSPAPEPPPFARHRERVDIVVCVHDALEDVRRCLQSVVRTTFPPYRLILVDDGSGPETAAYLASFAAAQGATLLRNETARGYTCAANQGLRAGDGEFIVLLNSDTVTTHQWLDRLLACARSDPTLAMVGPLSNTASWQSVPTVFGHDGDWARNELPAGLGPEEVAAMVARWSARLYPRLPFLNGFCLLLRRRLLDTVGLLDETTFPFGYGEENDLCLRAAARGFSLAVAEDAYVFHAQSRSYSDERRRALAAATDRALVAKHGAAIIASGVQRCRLDPVLAGARARLGFHLGRLRQLEAEARRWEGRRVLLAVAPGSERMLRERAWALAETLVELGVDARVAVAAGDAGDPTGHVPVVRYPVGTGPDSSAVDAVVDAATLASLPPAVELARFRPRPRSPQRRLRLALSLAPTHDRAALESALALLHQLVSRRGDLLEAVVFDDRPDEPLLRSPVGRFPGWRTGPLGRDGRAALLATVDVLLVPGHDPAALQLAAEARACGAVVVGPAAGALARPAGGGEAWPDWLAVPEFATLARLADSRESLETWQLAGIAASPADAVQEAAVRLLAAVVPPGEEDRQ